MARRAAPSRRRTPPVQPRRTRRPFGLRILAAAVAVVFLAGGVVLLVRGFRGGGEATRPAFEGSAALELVRRQVAFGPRVPNTPAHTQMLAWMRDYVGDRADTVSVHEFTHVTTEGDTLRLANVFASFEPDAPSRILLATHWDTRPVAEKDPDPARRSEPIPGANDGGSGTAVLLALADIFADHPLPEGYGVDLLFLDGEDYGHEPETFATRAEDMYLGAKEFARTHASYRPLFGILVDLVGDQEPVFKQEGYSLDYAPEVVRRIWQTAQELGYGEIFQEQALGYITDDHLFLNQAGIRTIDIIDFDYPHWHTTDDTVDKLSVSSLDTVGEVILEVLYRRM